MTAMRQCNRYARALAWVLLLSLTWPSWADEAPSSMPVLATTGMIGDMAMRVGGECVAVSVLMGPGIDPHLYQASASDVRRFENAELIVYNGFELEGQLSNVLARYDARRATLAVAEAAAQAGPLGAIKGGKGYTTDPHVWMDARFWSQGIAPLRDALTELRPECAADIAARATRYTEQLTALDDWMRASLATIPERQRALVTAHDAFNYYGRAYALEVRGIQGISTSAEAGVADIQQTARFLAERGIPAIFVESTINPRTVEAVVAAARQQSAEVVLGGELYGDALGEAGSLADSLIGMLIHNTASITQALGGTMTALPKALADYREGLVSIESVDS